MVRSSSLSELYEPRIEFRESNSLTEVFIRRYSHVPICDVIVTSGDRQLSIRCDDYEAAVKWAQVECRSYGVIAGVKVESEGGTSLG
jgi:hypothetical protein